MRLIGYTYNADHHCESCTLAYARAVPYSEYVWNPPNSRKMGRYRDEDIQVSPNQPGIINLAKAIRLGVIRDSENNAIHPMFDTDEWYANDIYEGKKSATLNCGDCGTELATWVREDWDR